jgi:hypothetical protein
VQGHRRAKCPRRPPTYSGIQRPEESTGSPSAASEMYSETGLSGGGGPRGGAAVSLWPRLNARR